MTQPIDEQDAQGTSLTTEKVSKGLGTLGMHPLALRHSFLELSLPRISLTDVDVLRQYPLLMYIDLSENRLESLSVLEHITALVTLKAKGNRLTQCLDFVAPLCDAQHAWAQGGQSVGSMLTLADLSDNLISTLCDLSRHRFLECLLLSNNKIQRIEGLQSLKYLQTLDLSHNNITHIEGLDDLPLRELRLSHNQIADLSGLANLPRLTALDVAHNRIASLHPLQHCLSLTYIDVRSNAIEQIRQTESLLEISFLRVLLMENNPCCQKDYYRLRVLYRLPNLKRLDQIVVSPEEKIRAFNLYCSSEGDLELRQKVHERFLPDVPFEDYTPEQLVHDEESELTRAELQVGRILSRRESR